MADLSPHKEALRRIFPSGRVHFADEVREGRAAMDLPSFEAYGRDRTTLPANPGALVFPESAQEAVALVRYARDQGLPLVPSGGRTGYAGGAVARDGEIVVSMERMNRVIEFDPHMCALRVEAGVPTRTVQEEASAHGLYFPVDFASSGSSHIGGNIATNAGGVRVVRYGSLRDRVAGMTVVTGAGELLEFNGRILKNNTGYDLKHLFIGSEGTLGLVLDATLA